jgi:hypothetical protein
MAYPRSFYQAQYVKKDEYYVFYLIHNVFFNRVPIL